MNPEPIVLLGLLSAAMLLFALLSMAALISGMAALAATVPNPAPDEWVC